MTVFSPFRGEEWKNRVDFLISPFPRLVGGMDGSGLWEQFDEMDMGEDGGYEGGGRVPGSWEAVYPVYLPVFLGEEKVLRGDQVVLPASCLRSEERRVGKEC